MQSDGDHAPEPTSENVSVSTVSTVDDTTAGQESTHVSAAAVGGPPDKPKVVWSQEVANPVSHFRTLEDHTAAEAEQVLKDRYYRNHSSEPSSVPTTVERAKQLVCMSDGDSSDWCLATDQ